MKRRRHERRRAGSHMRDLRHGSTFGLSTLILPQNLSLWSPKAGIKRIDIIPYEVSKGNPYADEGTWYYERTYWVHRNVGVSENSYVCPAKTVGKACPICEARSKLARDPSADKDVIRTLKPRERQLFLVYDHDETDKGVQLWDVSYFAFGMLLDDYRRDADESEKHIIDFDDFEAGSTLRVSFKEESIGSSTFVKAFRIDFKPRQKPLDDELLDHGICLDSLIKILSYEELRSIFYEEVNRGNGKVDDVDTDDEEEDDIPFDEQLNVKRSDEPEKPRLFEWDE